MRGKLDRRGGRYIPPPYLGPCGECGKKSYGTRKDAKDAAKRLYPGDKLSIYQCVLGWHIGHLPKRVIRGLIPGPRG